jgi:hypothetical protein
MGALSNYLESGILNHIFRGNKITDWSDLYIGLVSAYSAESLESGTSSELSGGGYARVQFKVDAGNWTAPYASGQATAIHNISGIAFPVATADIGTVAGVIIATAQAPGGDLLFHGPLTNSRTLTKDSQFIFPSGTLKVTFD